MAKGDVWGHDDEKVTFCCSEMDVAWHDGAVGFGSKSSYSMNHIAAVCIYACYPYPECTVWNEFPITVCPFCAVPIVLKQLPDYWLNEQHKKVAALA